MDRWSQFYLSPVDLGHTKLERQEKKRAKRSATVCMFVYACVHIRAGMFKQMLLKSFALLLYCPTNDTCVSVYFYRHKGPICSVCCIWKLAVFHQSSYLWCWSWLTTLRCHQARSVWSASFGLHGLPWWRWRLPEWAQRSLVCSSHGSSCDLLEPW